MPLINGRTIFSVGNLWRALLTLFLFILVMYVTYPMVNFAIGGIKNPLWKLVGQFIFYFVVIVGLYFMTTIILMKPNTVEVENNGKLS